METNLCYGGLMSGKRAQITEEAQVAFAGFVSAQTLKEAVAFLLPVLGKCVLEPKEANAGVWGGTFEFDYVHFSDGEDANYRSLMKKIKPGQCAVVVVGDDFVIISHVAEHCEQGGCTKAHLRFSKSVAHL